MKSQVVGNFTWVGVILVFYLSQHCSYSQWRVSYYNTLSCTGSIWAVKLHCLDKFCHTVTDQKIADLVPESCWTTDRNGNSISADVTDDAFENV